MQTFSGPASPPAPWTEPRVAALKRLWAEGKSAGEIAREIKGTSRCAVIGKANRLGLKPRGKAMNYAGNTAPKARKESAMNTVYNLPPSEKTDLPVEDRPTAKILAFRVFGKECAWPVGDGMACCGPVVRGQYCADHAARSAGPKAGRLVRADWGRDSGNPDRYFG